MSFGSDGTQLVTGALGGFGRGLAGWLVASGARHIVLVPSTVVVTGPRTEVEVRGPDVRLVPPSVDVRVNVPTVRFGVDVEGRYEDHHHHGMMHDNGRHLGWDNGRGHGMHGMHR